MTTGGDETGLGHDVNVTFREGRVDQPKEARQDPARTVGEAYPLLYQTKDVVFKVGDARWLTGDRDEYRKKLPRWEVGDWHTEATGNLVEAIPEVFGGRASEEPRGNI
ncbi:hypothetical protein DL771_004173 [Monosporascus sp. 5C6A]|nr:hypothetical protein DL771_004173 [Monosporascus sp. 5C6A]